ncbi:YfhO family protein [Salinimicrobium sediminilitoris]|uniref:YfhO family protein n=1 Tax=Salinimicrobium sediminilitoris TaxID=2876715 RepID=UPI001E651E73|nr:YfhO family protein [Salinimicrobium sediminilitoris]MCC8360236.1 YfhO family protein [Salinimicrobium sediminilitoris]
MNFSFKKVLPHILVVLGFIAISLAYFYPVLQGKEIFQSDIAQYIGMARQQNEFRAETGEEPYWTDAAFGGMPTYQLGANYPHNYVKELDRTLRFLPRPADYLFLYFIGMYILFLVLKIDYRLAFLGALAFGFSTYLIIILGVGHNAKAHAIAYMPWVIGGILLCFRRKYIPGFLLLAFGMALEISANHFQMTFYLLLLVIVIGIVYLINAFKKKELPQFFKAIGIMVVAVLLAIGANATNLMATQEYADFSTRGDTGLTITPDGTAEKTEGLDYNYITEYSYGVLESFNLFIPRFMGGSSAENVGTDSAIYNQLLQLGANPVQAAQFAEAAPTYWGDQPFVGAPAYIGATVLFLFVFALFLVRGKLKWWIVGGSLLALLLSWGKNFGILTDFFINYVPLYNKFRAVSSIQVLLELCIPILAIAGLSRLFFREESNDRKIYALKWATIITGGIALLFLLFKGMLFSFTGASDGVLIQQLGPEFVRALKEDRRAVFTADTFRSLILVLLTAAVLWFYLKQKFTRNIAFLALGALILFDLVGVGKRYVDSEDFVLSSVVNQPFQATGADREIMKDDAHYRVFDLSGSPFNTARTSFFHNSVGGYHAAKPGRMQELYDFYLSQNNLQVLNMLNTKYFIVPTEEGPVAQENPETNGNAWFIQEVKLVENANEAIKALEGINTKKVAVVDNKFADQLPKKQFAADTTAQIELVFYQPNELVYRSSSENGGMAVFSEIYYQHGWQAYINGEEVPHFRVNYVLRAMMVPAGQHEITFRFEPQVVKTGSSIALASSILLGLLLVGGIVWGIRRR